MNHEMLSEMAFLEESFSAMGTNVGAFASVPHPVLLEQLTRAELFSALSAFVRLLTGVDAHVCRQLTLHAVHLMANLKRNSV